MKTKDIVVGGTYVAQVSYGEQRVKVTVLDVPVVRMREVTHWRDDKREMRMRPERADGRADGARVRCEQPTRHDWGSEKYPAGREVVVQLAKVLRPWTDDDETRLAEEAAFAPRVAALREACARVGLVPAPKWYGEGKVAEDCVVSVPFVEFERWLARVAPLVEGA